MHPDYSLAHEYALAVARAVARLRQMATLESPPAEVETEVDGLQLHLSSRSATGYLGVRLSKSGDRFRAEHADTNLGTFDTAVEAAVAYAKQNLKVERVQ